MRLITCHAGKLQDLLATSLAGAATSGGFATGLPALDALLPPGGLSRGAIHEILFPPNGATPLTFALLLAQKAAGTNESDPHPAQTNPVESNPNDPNQSRQSSQGGKSNQSRQSTQFGKPSRVEEPNEIEEPNRGGDFGRCFPPSPIHNSLFTIHHSAPSPAPPPHKTIMWCDPQKTLYPPALARAGVCLDRFYLIRPRSAEEEIWAVAECLRCKGVGAVIANLPKLTRVQARRLQLAAEAGGGAGLLIRPAAATIYAAATRWLVSPARGQRTIQRWTIQLLHGHGGRVHHTVYLERNRETHALRSLESLAHPSVSTRPAQPAASAVHAGQQSLEAKRPPTIGAA